MDQVGVSYLQWEAWEGLDRGSLQFLLCNFFTISCSDRDSSNKRREGSHIAKGRESNAVAFLISLLLTVYYERDS